MTDDNELERRQFMQKPVPAKPKLPSGNATSTASPSPSPLFEKFVSVQEAALRRSVKVVSAGELKDSANAFADFATIVKLLRRHDQATRLQILELVTELIH